jgi:hypothetical protein
MGVGLSVTAGSAYLASNTVAPSNAGEVTVVVQCSFNEQINQGIQGDQDNQGSLCNQGDQGNEGN